MRVANQRWRLRCVPAPSDPFRPRHSSLAHLQAHSSARCNAERHPGNSLPHALRVTSPTGDQQIQGEETNDYKGGKSSNRAPS